MGVISGMGSGMGVGAGSGVLSGVDSGVESGVGSGVLSGVGSGVLSGVVEGDGVAVDPEESDDEGGVVIIPLFSSNALNWALVIQMSSIQNSSVAISFAAFSNPSSKTM